MKALPVSARRTRKMQQQHGRCSNWVRRRPAAALQQVQPLQICQRGCHCSFGACGPAWPAKVSQPVRTAANVMGPIWIF